MNILIINQDWFAKELRDMGHAVLTCGTAPHLEHRIPTPIRHIDQLLAELPNSFTPDRILWLDNSAPIYIIGLEDCSIPILFYSVDTHHHYGLHSYLADSFDHVLIAQRDFMDHFKRSNTPCSWMPLWAPVHVEQSLEKKFGATFVGTLDRRLNPDRVTFFEALQALVPIHVTQGNYQSIFPFAEIIVNQTVKGDLNFRVFETMMCGAMLLTEKTTNGLLDIFQDNKHLATYTPRDASDAAEKVRYYTHHVAAARTIAEAGRSEILAKHTALHRALQVESILATLSRRSRSPHTYFGALMNASILSTCLESVNKPLGAELSIVALAFARKILEHNIAPDTTATTQIIRACLRHDILTGMTAGNNTIAEFASAFPQLPLFSLLHVRALLNSGKRLEAHKVAEIISHAPPEALFDQAEQVATVIMR